MAEALFAVSVALQGTMSWYNVATQPNVTNTVVAGSMLFCNVTEAATMRGGDVVRRKYSGSAKNKPRACNLLAMLIHLDIFTLLGDRQ